MKQNLLLLFACILFTGSIEIQAQEESTSDISGFLDDGGFSNRKNVVSVNLYAILNGDIPFLYERVLSDYWTIEVGAGLLLPYYGPEIASTSLGEIDMDNLGFGNSFSIEGKYYLDGKAPELWYSGILWRSRFFHPEKQDVQISDLSAVFGAQFFIGNHFTFDWSSGFGYRFYHFDLEWEYDEPGRGMLSILLKLGYNF